MNKKFISRVISLGLIIGIGVLGGVEQNLTYANNGKGQVVKQYNKYLTAEKIEHNLNHKVENKLKNIVEDGYFKGENNVNIYYKKYNVKKSKGSIVISHGYTESLEKYKELIYYFVQEGYSVYGIEHRGHGRSGRLNSNFDKQVHIEDFDFYVNDLKTFMDEIVVPESKDEKIFLFGHSMGGAIGGLFLERHEGYFDAAILNAPMMQLVNENSTDSIIEYLNSKIENGESGNFFLGSNEYNATPDLEGAGTSSEGRYNSIHKIITNNKIFQMTGGSVNWFKESLEATNEVVANSNKINVPVLLFQAGKDSYVMPGGQDKFVAGNPRYCKLIRYDEAKHEMYFEKDEILFPYLEDVFDFYDNNLK